MTGQSAPVPAAGQAPSGLSLARTGHPTTDELFYPSSAVFSTGEEYRYLLTRQRAAGPALVFIMLNPSTADARKDDPTIRRCIRFAAREGAGVLAVVNLFALRATDPRELRRHPDPAGPRNDEFIDLWCRPGRPVIAAWGAGGGLLGRDREVATRLAAAGVSLSCLGVTRDGHPRHPLYVRSDAPLLPYGPGITTS